MPRSPDTGQGGEGEGGPSHSGKIWENVHPRHAVHGTLYICIYIYMHGFTGYTLRIHKYTHILTQTGLSTHKQVMHFYNSTVCAVYTVIACGLRRLGGGCSNYDLDAISFLLALPLLQASRSQDVRWADVERVLKRHPRLVAVTSV